MIDIRRRALISLLGGATVTRPLGVRAQQSVTPVIAFLQAPKRASSELAEKLQK